MWTLVAFAYNVISLAISSAASIKLRNLKSVEKVTYINNIALIVSAVAVTAAVVTYLTLKLGCERAHENIQFGYYSVIILTILGLFVEAIYIAIVSNSEFKNCPKDVQNLFTVALVVNSLGAAGAIGFTVHKAIKMRHPGSTSREIEMQQF